MISRWYRALSVSLLTPVVIVAACGGDDTLAPAVDGGADAARDSTANKESGADGTSPDATNDSDVSAEGAPRDSAVVDSGIDAPRDVGADSTALDDAGIDAPPDTSTPPDASSSDASVDVQVFDGGSCNTLANSGPSVPETRVAANAPVAVGGAIPLGLYYLTKWEVFTGPGGATGPTGNTRKLAFYFYATTYLKVTADNGAGDENDNRRWSTSGATLDSFQYCPTNDVLSSDYTVSGNSLVVIAPPQVLTFAHQ